MNPVLKEILDLLAVERIEENLYRGQNHNTEHVFGGQVLAQAIASAYRTVEVDHHLHSIHAYFLRAGDWNRPILYEVDRIRDGRSFSNRRVTAVQHGKAIFSLASSWQKDERALCHSVPMPDVLPPESLRGDREFFAEMEKDDPGIKRFSFRFEAIDSRQVESRAHRQSGSAGALKHTWMRTRDPLPDSPEVHLAMLAYMSDMDFMSTSLLPHLANLVPNQEGRTHQGASLDHALWIHQPFRADEWLLFTKTSPNASGARGFVRGHFYNRAGEMVATAAQECLIRPLKGTA